jgi:hypothetical protein
MKMTKQARAELNMMSMTDKKKVVSATRTLLQARLIAPALAKLVTRNYK